MGDRVTCINKRWNVRIDVRITEIAETYETSGEEIDITFGELARASDTNSADYEIKEGFTAWKNQVSSTAFRTIARTKRRIGRNTSLRSSGTAFSPSLRRGFKSLQTTE
ncbi:MAG: Gp37-like protein [Oscillospiraceae bacterium]